MPSQATITAFYSFTANTKARASQVNGNFDVFRGHLLPIDPNTQTAISATYDLGSSDYRWRAVYLPATSGTLSAAVGDFAFGPTLSADYNTTASLNISGTTLTISTIGRPVEYSFVPNSTANDGGYFHVGVTSTSDFAVNMTLMRDNVTVSSLWFGGPAGNALARQFPPAQFKFIDRPAAGTYVYHVKMNISQGSARFATVAKTSAYAREF